MNIADSDIFLAEIAECEAKGNRCALVLLHCDERDNCVDVLTLENGALVERRFDNRYRALTAAVEIRSLYEFRRPLLDGRVHRMDRSQLDDHLIDEVFIVSVPDCPHFESALLEKLGLKLKAERL